MTDIMLRMVLLLMITVCGLEARSPAQVHFGVRLGERVAVRAGAGPISVHYGSRNRDVSYHSGRRVSTRRYASRRPQYRWVTERVWIPGCYEDVYVPARYETVRDACGRLRTVLVEPACYQKVWREGYWKYERRRVRC